MRSPGARFHGGPRSSLTLIIGTAVTAVLSAAYVISAGRLLGPGEYSAFVVILSFVQLCSVAAGPLNSTVAHFGARYLVAGELGKLRTLLSGLARRVALWGLLAGGVSALALAPLARLLKIDSVIPLLLGLVIVYLSLLVALARGALRGLQRFDDYAWNLLLDAAARILCGLALLQLLRSASAGLMAYPVALLATLLLARIQLRTLFEHTPARVERDRILRFTASMTLLALGYAGFQNLDMMAVKSLLPPVEAGWYGSALMVARLMTVVFMPIQILALPRFTALQQNHSRLSAPALRLCAFYAALAALPLLLLWLIPEVIFGLLYDARFEPAAALALPLAGAVTLMNMGLLLAQALSVTGRLEFLWFYLPALGLELVALAAHHASLTDVVQVVLATQALVFVVLLSFLLVSDRRADEGRGAATSSFPQAY